MENDLLKERRMRLAGALVLGNDEWEHRALRIYSALLDNLKFGEIYSVEQITGLLHDSQLRLSLSQIRKAFKNLRNAGLVTLDGDGGVGLVSEAPPGYSGPVSQEDFDRWDEKCEREATEALARGEVVYTIK